MMKAKGWQKVRGGFWCNVGEIETIKNLQHHGYFSDIDIEDISFNKESNSFIFLNWRMINIMLVIHVLYKPPSKSMKRYCLILDSDKQTYTVIKVSGSRV